MPANYKKGFCQMRSNAIGRNHFLYCRRAALGNKKLTRDPRRLLTFVLLTMAYVYGIDAMAAPDPAALNMISDAVEARLLSTALNERTGVTIGRIQIENENIFDLSNPDENSWLYRTANTVHIKTRPDVIRQQLLFKPGDVYSKQVLEESERVLRSNRYLQDASIEPVRYENGVVDLRVATTDVWTLSPSISFGRSGGTNSGSIGLKEQNLFGTGIRIGVAYKADVDRDSTSLVFQDKQLGKSWIGLFAAVAQSSDGHTRALKVDRPFFSLDSRGAGGVAFLDDDKVSPLYSFGEKVSEYRHQTRSYDAYGGWSKGLVNGGARRFMVGLAYEDHQFSQPVTATAPTLLVPDDRRFVYPFVAVDFIQDRFEKTTNHDQISRTEDRFLGTRFGAKLGFVDTAFGSSHDAMLLSAHAQRGFGSSKGRSLLLQSDIGTRVKSGEINNLILTGAAKYYHRQSEKRLLFFNLTGSYGQNLDVDTQISLGGDNGLRGYPLRYQNGDKSALLTIEQRYFTDWYPFRLFHVGGAVFFDAGRVWGRNAVGTDSLGLLKDVGFGLRIGNSRSGLGRMAHIDIAFPLDGEKSINNVQFLVGLKQGF